MRWTSLIFVLALAFAGAGCSDRDSEAFAVGGAFVFARGSDAQKLDPADVDDGESVNVLAQVCEGLVRFAPGTLEVEPCLAESYTVSGDGLVYRFRLREGVRFHDGTPLDAEAAAYSFQRQMDPSHPGHYPEAAFSYWNYLYQDISEVVAVEPMELEIRLSRPNAAMIRSLAIFPAFLVSPRSHEMPQAERQRRPIGTGAYRFSEWRPNEFIALERNEDYWDGAPALERLAFTVVPDNTTRALQLKSGAVHGMDGLQPAEVAGLRRDPAVVVYEEAGLNLAYLAINLERERMALPEVREALALGIDRQRLAEVALEGLGRAASYPIPPGMPGYPDVEEPIPFDPERARALLEPHADRFRGDPVVIHVMNAPRPYLPDPVTAASFLKGQLDALGLETRVVVTDFKSHLDLLRNGAFELGLIGWVGDNGDSDNFLSVFFASWAAEKGAATNYSFYRHDAMDELLRTARATIDAESREALYDEVLRLWRRDLPIIPLCHGSNVVALRAGFSGFQLQKTSDLRLVDLRRD